MRLNLLDLNGNLVASKLINTIAEADEFMCLVADVKGESIVPVVEFV